MPSFMKSNIWLMIFSLIIRQALGVPYNQPKFCSNATWNETGIIFADNNNTNILDVQGIFINSNNTVFVADRTNNRILIWLEGASDITKVISAGLNFPYSLFVTITDDIFVDNGDINGRVDMWASNVTYSIPILQVIGACYGLFVDINDHLYCSMQYLHQVVRKPLNDSTNTLITMFGTGCSGMASNMLNRPVGIFVDVNLNLFVADYGNNRIQLFPSGQSNATTVAGNASIYPFPLDGPTGIVLDADENLFIVDQNNHRIVRSGPNGFQCIIGCTQYNSSTFDQLNNPRSLSFDSYGNIFVTDTGNRCIQQFLLAMNSCNETLILRQTITPMTDTETLIYTATPNSVANQSNNFYSTVLSINQPKFCSYTSWNPNGTTLVSIGRYATSPLGIFVDINNTIYIADRHDNRIIIWPEDPLLPTRNISGGFNSPYSVFVTFNGDIYIDNAKSNGRVDEWTSNATNTTPVLYVNNACYGLFVDISDNLYCSIKDLHQVVKKLFNSDQNTSTIVAGTGCAGMTSDMLKDPTGIFVDKNFNLYVADSSNNRIQLFPSGQLRGITVAGNGAQGTISLYSPTSVVLDADGYLFIVDQKNHRIVGSGPRGFQCIVGCTGYSGSASDQLLYPRTLSFDSYGNIYVSDTNNNRIQNFSLATNSCNETTTLQPIITSTASTEETSMLLTTFGLPTTFHRIEETKRTTSTTTTKGMIALVPYATGTAASVLDTTNMSTSVPHATDMTTSVLDTTNMTAAVPRVTGMTTSILNTKNMTTPVSDTKTITTSVPDTKNMTTSVLDTTNMTAAAPRVTGMTTPVPNTTNIATSVLYVTDMTTSVPDVTDMTTPVLSTTNMTTSVLDATDTTTTYSKHSTITSSSTVYSTSIFKPPSCPNQNRIGIRCNISAIPCDMIKPCQNNGTCINSQTALHGYTCSCSSGFNGSSCEIDHRPCQPYTCWNDGICNETSDTTFNCLCQPGWTGIHCEMKINYCKNVTCLNRGGCHPLLMNFTCECLGTSYSGRYCEITSTKIVIYQAVSKSFAYIVIIFLLVVVFFVVLMDILKYGFGIDPTKDELARIRRVKRRRPPPIIQRFIYVNALPPTTDEPHSTIEERIIEID